jgi:hypothetical protein
MTKPTKVLSEPCETVSRHTARQFLFTLAIHSYRVPSIVPTKTKLLCGCFVGEGHFVTPTSFGNRPWMMAGVARRVHL